MEGSGQSFDVFFSYHWRDHVPVEAVARALIERGLRVFLDRWYLTPGQPWPQALERTLASCHAVAVFLGADGLGPWQQRERDLALDRQGREPGFPVIPVLLTRADPALGFLKLNTWVDLSANVADQAALEILCAAVHRQSPGPAGLQQIAAVRAEICPYRGLRPFREEDAEYFCGREAFTEKLTEAVERGSLVAVMGASGSGKSSVVRAGLIPRLRQTKAGQVWEIATLVPTDRPLHSLAAALVPILEPEMTRIDRLAEINKLAGHFAEGAVALRDVTADVLRAQPGTDRLLLFVDQWEELYTLVADDGARRRFLAEVLDASATRVVSVVLTLRGDFFKQALSDRTLADRLQDGQVNLGPMTQEELRRSIVNPAEKAGLQFEPGLVDWILEDVGQEPGNLPLLEFVLAALWEQRQGVTLLHAAYERMGGVEGAIAARANAEFDKLDAAQKDAARRVLIQMVRPGEGTEDTRQRALLPSGNETALAVIRRLADARLVVTARNAATGEETVEVTHEALIRNWTLLRGWVDADREFLRTKARIEAAEELWQKENRDHSRLLAEGRPLAEGEEILARRRQDLSPDLVAFIETSAARARKGRQRKRLIATGVMAVPAVLTGVATWFGYDARLKERDAIAQRQIALARQLAAQASLLIDRGGSGAIIERVTALAVESWRRMRNADAMDIAHRFFTRLPSSRFARAGRPLAFSPDARLLVTGDLNAVRLIETENGKEVARLAHEGEVWAVAFSPDGRWLTTRSGFTARLIEMATGREMARVAHDRQVSAVAFSPDSRWLATASEDGTARLIEMATGREIARIAHEDEVQAVAFSPDGRWLTTRSGFTARLIEVATGREAARVSYDGRVVSVVAFSPDSRWLATASDYDTMRLIETATGREVARLAHDGRVAALAFSTDGRWLTTASGDGRARLIEAATGREAEGRFHDVAFSPDGRLLATASEDGTARLIEMAVGREIARIAHEGEVQAVAFSPDGRWLTTRSGTMVRLIEAATGRMVARIAHDSSVSCVAFSPDGRWLATCDLITDRLVIETVRLIETVTGREAARILHDGRVEALAFSSDSRWLATASGDGTARLIEAEGGSMEVVGRVSAVVFSPDGRLLAAASEDSTARLIETATGKEVVRLAHDGRVAALAFSPDSRWLTTRSESTVRLIEAASGTEVARIAHENTVWDVTFSPDSRLLVTASQLYTGDPRSPIMLPGTARLIETATGTEVARIAYDGRVEALAFSPDGRWLVTRGGPPALLIEVASGKVVARIVQYPGIGAVSFSPDGRWLATASSGDSTERLIETATGKEVEDHVYYDVAFSPDGRWLATASEDGTARLIEATTGKETARIAHDNAVTDVAFSPDGRWLATASEDGTARLIETPTGKEVARIAHENTVWDVTFSSDSRWLATASQDGTARLIKTGSGREVARIAHEDEVQAIAFSTDGRWLATASSDYTARLIETGSGREVARVAHEDEVQAIAFSTDGRWLATASSDYTARLIETGSGREVARIAHDDAVGAVAFSPDSRMLLTTGTVWIRRVKLFWADPQHVFDLLCAKAGRNLSPDEWRTYIGADEPWRPTCPNWRNAEAPAQDR